MTTAPRRRSFGAALGRRALAELVGTGMLATVVVGSGIAAERLSADTGLQLLANSAATALGLAVLILLLAPVSGAHLNPVVTLAEVLRHRPARAGLPVRIAGIYLLAQTLGAISGAVLGNTMFATATTLSTTGRATPATFLGEIVATTGLLMLIIGLNRAGRTVPVIAAAVGSYVGAAYWFTSSTGFANPALTIGRIFTDTFAGIAPASAAVFLTAQFIGAATAVGLSALLFPTSPARNAPFA